MKYLSIEDLRKMVKNWDGKLYKVFRGSNFEPTQGIAYNWQPGEWTDLIEDVCICNRGYHLTTHYAHWWSGGEIWLAESDSIVEFDGYDKVVCERVRLIKKLDIDSGDHNSVYRNSGSYNSGDNNSGDNNSGDHNSGYGNSGNYNSGSYNSGDHNSGYWNLGNYNSCDHNSGRSNSGYWNLGNYNPGNYNSGDRNSGHNNSGSYNSGSYNSGDHNSGYGNSGNRNSGYNNSGSYNSSDGNSGDRNSGYWNSGSYNSGDRNSGNWNSGSYNSGDNNSGNWNSATGPHNHLCSRVQKMLFNKPIDKFPEFPKWFYWIDSWADSFSRANHNDLMETINLPNFDYDVFEEITGISKVMIEAKLGNKNEY